MATNTRQLTTFTDFILENETLHENASGHFTLLLELIARCGKIIGSHVRASGLVDIVGSTGRKNVFAEEVQKLDEYSNALLIKTLSASHLVSAMVSEEEKEVIQITDNIKGKYIVYFDPLDGSSNIDTNAPIGTIFGIYHAEKGQLQQGQHQLAAGYILYGASTMLIYTTGKTVDGFTLDPSIGSFLLSHPNIQIPPTGSIYSLNEAYSFGYDKSIQDFLKHMKAEQNMTGRYIGALVADAHRILLKGGIYLYPTDPKHPEGKLRLTIEANPISMIIKTAGGKAVGYEENILEKTPQHIHERTPFVFGSLELVDKYLSFVQQ